MNKLLNSEKLVLKRKTWCNVKNPVVTQEMHHHKSAKGKKKGADRSESMVAQALFSAVPPFRHICYAPSRYPLKSISEIAMERLLPIAFCPMKMQFWRATKRQDIDSSRRSLQRRSPFSLIVEKRTPRFGRMALRSAPGIMTPNRSRFRHNSWRRIRKKIHSFRLNSRERWAFLLCNSSEFSKAAATRSCRCCRHNSGRCSGKQVEQYHSLASVP